LSCQQTSKIWALNVLARDVPVGSGAVLCLQDPQQNKEFKGTGLVLFAKNVHGDDDDDDDDDDTCLLSWCQIKIERTWSQKNS